MIGQKDNIKWIDTLVEKGTFPHFLVIVGDKGSGKTMLSKYIAKRLGASFGVSGIKVDEIREVIDTAYKTSDNAVYCIQNADTMRQEAKNAMLKITEEPPKNAYFIMTVCDSGTLLDTIKSRAFILEIQPYTNCELAEYYRTKYTMADSDIDLVSNIAGTPYEVDKIIEYGGDFIDYVNLVIDNIAEVDCCNAFKSSEKLQLKNEAGYELNIFFRAFYQICLNRLAYCDAEDYQHYAEGVIVTANHLKEFYKLGVNLTQLYDSWVFSIREAWL